MEKEKKIFELLENTGLNWTVSKKELVSAEGLKTESFGIFRNDNNSWLGTVGVRYQEMQNHVLASTIISAGENIDINVQRGGLLQEGKKVFLQAQLPDEYIGNSGVKRYITALNSHNGSTSIAFGSSSTVVVCENTFFMAYGELSKIRHTATSHERIEVVMRDMRRTIEMDNKLMTNFKRMADLPLKDELVERVIRKMFTVSPNDKQDDISTRKLNQLKQFSASVEKEINLEGKTVWGLFNGVTRYVNHVSAPQTNADSKLNYIMDGRGYDIATQSFDEIMKWVEANTPKLVPVN